jgi:hypothetical protein
MEWTVWVVKVYGITKGSWITGLREGKETFPSRISQIFKIYVSWDCVVLCCTVSKWKVRFRVTNELICCLRIKYKTIVMDSDSDKEAYYISTDTEDEQQPRPPSPISKPASPDYCASSSEDEGDVDNVAGRQPQPSQWTLPPKPRKHVVHTFIGAPKGNTWQQPTLQWLIWHGV